MDAKSHNDYLDDIGRTTFHARQFSLEEADAVYLKLRSPRQN